MIRPYDVTRFDPLTGIREDFGALRRFYALMDSQQAAGFAWDHANEQDRRDLLDHLIDQMLEDRDAVRFTGLRELLAPASTPRELREAILKLPFQGKFLELPLVLQVYIELYVAQDCEPPRLSSLCFADKYLSAQARDCEGRTYD